ncbi:MAG TPA: alpha-glucan family phosphorylase [Acidimicrobiia bacterium]|nr:alpha-glucan family phosphorylase [Acidimicrobiia bacterium]
MSAQPSLVAYFSPEFGLDAAIPQYAGGLGVLAGDHLKAAADAGVPLVGVGLFYRQGYFHQAIAPDGRMGVEYRDVDPSTFGFDLVGETEVDVGDDTVELAVWRHDVGSVPLFLVDPGEGPATRAIGDRLYGGDVEHRLRQEIVLGMGGLRALDVAGVTPEVFHLNEGHAGFLALERIRRYVERTGATLAEAVEALAPSTVFTTHTPVPAGIDRFGADLMERSFSRWCKDVGVTLDDLLALGAMPEVESGGPGPRREGTDERPVFNMAAFCLRIAGHANGVSRLHGRVSRRMFAPLWPGVAEDDVPIGSVTNGVHAPTWTAPEFAALFERSVGSEWPSAPPSAWDGVGVIGDDEIRAARRAAKGRLAEVVAARSVVEGATLDEDALVVGFARRFATYKRAALLLSDPDRLARLVGDRDRPVQILYAGKPHPDDRDGQAVLAQVAQAAADPAFGGRIVLLEDYDMAVGRALVQGCDVWLNTPIRGLEASGTSGEKAALNGVLHCSVLDGWWDEMFDGENGWAIPAAGDAQTPASERDEAEAAATFDVLEREVVPLYFEGGTDGRAGERPSSAWLDRVRAAWRSLGPQVTAARMIADYVDGFYLPASRP